MKIQVICYLLERLVGFRFIFFLLFQLRRFMQTSKSYFHLAPLLPPSPQFVVVVYDFLTASTWLSFFVLGIHARSLHAAFPFPPASVGGLFLSVAC